MIGKADIEGSNNNIAMNTKVIGCCISASVAVVFDQDVRVASCLVCQHQFSMYERRRLGHGGEAGERDPRKRGHHRSAAISWQNVTEYDVWQHAWYLWQTVRT